MNNSAVYLDSYVLQNDMRVRLPKAILSNLPIEKGKPRFAIYFDKTCGEIILKVEEQSENLIED